MIFSFFELANLLVERLIGYRTLVLYTSCSCPDGGPVRNRFEAGGRGCLFRPSGNPVNLIVNCNINCKISKTNSRQWTEQPIFCRARVIRPCSRPRDHPWTGLLDKGSPDKGRKDKTV